jgi:N-(2-amino-2-carboxyethyl)-L-glutamate synthase
MGVGAGVRVISSPHEFNVGDLYLDLRQALNWPLHVKVEGFNFAGSVKLKAAVSMVDAMERDGVLLPGGVLVESSSGNLGIALSLVAASRGYGFICVTDSRCTMTARQYMRAMGTDVHVVAQPHPQDGFLGARLRYVRQLCRANPSYVWLNQYASPANWRAHQQTTGPEILRGFPDIDVLFVGAGTTGTLMGCARFFREAKPSVRIVAIDAVGSVTFGTPSEPRLIPGLGTSVRPPVLDESFVDDVVHVTETATVQACRSLARAGFMLGGSTGTVVSGALSWLTDHRSLGELVAVAISPDLGEKYLDTIYRDQWVTDTYGDDALDRLDMLSEVLEEIP